MIKTAENESVKKAKVGSPATLTLAWPSQIVEATTQIMPKAYRKKEGEKRREAKEPRKVECKKEDKAAREKGRCKCRGQSYGM